MMLQTNLDVHAVLTDIARERDRHVAEGRARDALQARQSVAPGNSTVVRFRQWVASQLQRERALPARLGASRRAMRSTA